ncbi:MAG: hypothetical protein KC656_34875, partial [Myxococcales bacterium]|nr:hypothetical protein [Myxococcales bacterium]
VRPFRLADIQVGGGASVLGVLQDVAWLVPSGGGGVDGVEERATQVLPGVFGQGIVRVAVGPRVGLEAGTTVRLARGVVDEAPRLLLSGTLDVGVAVGW